MQHRPSLPASVLANVSSRGSGTPFASNATGAPVTSVTPEGGLAVVDRGGLFGKDSVRAVLERLSTATDDTATAMSLLLVLRTFALEHGEGLVVELSSVDIGMLVTIEDPTQDLWVAEMLPLTMRTVRGLLAEMPEILLAFEKTETNESLTLRMPSLGLDLTSRMTPVALPSIGLLLEAGLLTRRVREPSPPQDETS